MVENNKEIKSIIDIKQRYGLSRLGTWNINGSDLGIPLIAGIQPYDVNYQRVDVMVGDILASRQSTEKKMSVSNKKKLYIYHHLNPLVDYKDVQEANQTESKDQKNEPYLIVPGTISYPECFNELGISINAVSPNNIDNNINTSEFIQLFTGPTDKLKPGPGLIILNNGLKLFENPRAFVKRIISINHRHDPNRLLYIPGVASVNNLAVLVYLGVDLVDTSQCILEARAGNLMMGAGVIPMTSLTKPICSCDGCTELQQGNDAFNSILKHNEHMLESELEMVKIAIARGQLREYVEQKMVTDPALSSIIRILDLEYFDTMEPYFPIFQHSPLFASSREALNRPEIIRFRNRVSERNQKPEDAKILLLLPCSAKKPYSTSKSHRAFNRAIHNAIESNRARSLIHEVIITSPLGLVPRELELVYPAQQYDIPVTGHWFEDERVMLKDCIINYLKKNPYEYIIIHLPDTLGKVIEDSIDTLVTKTKSKIKPQIILTCTRSPTSKHSLDNLTKGLSKILGQCLIEYKIPKNHHHFRTLKSISRFQFGEVGTKLVEDCEIKGRYPNLKILKNNTQVGMLTGARGMISLTLPGAKLLSKELEFGYKISIDDFIPSGSIMAVGVLEADPKIRIGDEVIACYHDEVRGVGQAVLNGSEMVQATRGPAVKVRHHM